jgi:hypothetical protein
MVTQRFDNNRRNRSSDVYHLWRWNSFAYGTRGLPSTKLIDTFS